MEPATPDRRRLEGPTTLKPLTRGRRSLWSSLSGMAGTAIVWVAAYAVFSALAIAAGVIWLSWTLRTWRRK